MYSIIAVYAVSFRMDSMPALRYVIEVSQRAYDVIHYISGLYGYLYVCEIYVTLIWYLYLFMLNKFCLSLSHYDVKTTSWRRFDVIMTLFLCRVSAGRGVYW